MDTLFRLVYLASLFLWIPLLSYFVWARPVSVRRVFVLAIVMSAIASAYEGYMTFVWGPTVTAPIRIDIFVVMLLLGLVNGVCGGILLYTGSGTRKGHKKQVGLIVMGLLCLSTPVLAIIGMIGMASHVHALTQTIDNGRRYRFEAAFRDNDTQRRIFGELHSNSKPWAGYYAGDNKDPRYQHLIINDEGRFWLYGQALYMTAGRGGQSIENQNQFQGQDNQAIGGPINLSLDREADNTFRLLVKNTYGASQRLTFTKSAPPRYPVVPSKNDEVEFIGVFSARYGAHENSFWVSQAWLWESQGKMWGRYLRDNYKQGQINEFIHAESIKPKCTGECKDLNLSFASGRGPVKLTRISENEIKARLDGVYEEIILSRGEIVPGFILDLAPLTNVKQNQEWIDAVTAGTFISWDLSERTGTSLTK